MHDDALRRMQRNSERLWHRVRDGDELDVEGPNLAPLAVFHRNKFCATEESGFFDAMTGKPQREGRAVDGEAQFAQQIAERANVIFVGMGSNAANDAMGVFAQVREVGQHKIDAVHTNVGEHKTAIEHEELVVLLKHHAVPTDLTQPAEKRNAYRRWHPSNLAAPPPNTTDGNGQQLHSGGFGEQRTIQA